MRPVVVTLTATGFSAPVVLDYFRNPFNVGLAYTATGTATCKVQMSFDDPFATYTTSYNVDATWFDHAAMTSLTTNTMGSQTVPVRALRLACHSYTSGTPKLTVIQPGGPGA